MYKVSISKELSISKKISFEDRLNFLILAYNMANLSKEIRSHISTLANTPKT